MGGLIWGGSMMNRFRLWRARRQLRKAGVPRDFTWIQVEPSGPGLGYDRVLTAEEMQRVHRYLDEKYRRKEGPNA